ncbi:MAG: DUF4349 domain-containing protein [Spirochaetes bacterium]|nr:DUF4349 domain-containing protein [Spirochaetota bacterium]
MQLVTRNTGSFLIIFLAFTIVGSSFYCGSAERREEASSLIQKIPPHTGSDSTPASAQEETKGIPFRSDDISEPNIPNEKTQPITDNRLVIYSAEYRIRVESVEKALQSVNETTRRLGGFIESLTASDSYKYAKVIARVPAAKFEEALDANEKLGNVEHKTISASDVTMQYNDIALRISTSKKIRDRLYALLQKASKPSEKAEILQEIARLTTEIDNLTAQINYLKSKVDFSTISLELFALVREITGHYMASPFLWIASLNPYRRSIFHNRDGNLRYETPEGFFSYEDVYFKEYSNLQDLFVSPETNVKVKVGVVENYPKASQKFWKEAVDIDFANRRYEIKERKHYQTAGSLYFDSFAIELPAKDIYMLAFSVINDKIIVVEAYAKDESSFSENRLRVERFIASIRYD